MAGSFGEAESQSRRGYLEAMTVASEVLRIIPPAVATALRRRPNTPLASPHNGSLRCCSAKLPIRISAGTKLGLPNLLVVPYLPEAIQS